MYVLLVLGLFRCLVIRAKYSLDLVCVCVGVLHVYYMWRGMYVRVVVCGDQKLRFASISFSILL